MIAFVYNAGYKQLTFSVFTMHDQYMPPPPPAPPLPAVPGLFEGMPPLGWGFLGHKKAPTVLVDGGPGIQQGHDVGYLIPHVAVPFNALMALHTALSKHKIMFPVTSVLLEGKPVGTNLVGLVDLICANPVSLPTGGILPLGCTVQTSASAGDILRGLGYIAVDIMVDGLWNRLKGTRAVKWATDKTSSLADPLKGFLGDAWVDTGKLLFLDLYHGGLPTLLGKVFQGLVKGWVLSPAVGGAARGNPGIGRGPAGTSWKPFGDKWTW